MWSDRGQQRQTAHRTATASGARRRPSVGGRRARRKTPHAPIQLRSQQFKGDTANRKYPKSSTNSGHVASRLVSSREVELYRSADLEPAQTLIAPRLSCPRTSMLRSQTESETLVLVLDNQAVSLYTRRDTMATGSSSRARRRQQRRAAAPAKQQRVRMQQQRAAQPGNAPCCRPCLTLACRACCSLLGGGTLAAQTRPLAARRLARSSASRAHGTAPATVKSDSQQASLQAGDGHHCTRTQPRARRAGARVWRMLLLGTRRGWRRPRWPGGGRRRAATTSTQAKQAAVRRAAHAGMQEDGGRAAIKVCAHTLPAVDGSAARFGMSPPACLAATASLALAPSLVAVGRAQRARARGGVAAAGRVWGSIASATCTNRGFFLLKYIRILASHPETILVHSLALLAPARRQARSLAWASCWTREPPPGAGTPLTRLYSANVFFSG